MRRVSVGFAAAATMAVALVGAPSASAQEVLAASCEPPQGGAISGGEGFAQSFTPSQTGPLTRAELNLARSEGDTSTADFVIEIRLLTAVGEPGAILASQPLAYESVGEAPDFGGGATNGPFTNVSVVFANPALVQAGGGYALAVRRPEGSFSYQRAFGCPGSAFSTSNDGDSWESGFLGDMSFRVFVVPVGPDVPLTCKGESVTLLGTDNADEISGTRGPDVISALGGNDTVRGFGSDDLICGGVGRDRLIGGSSDDDLFGQGGKDKLKGKRGSDRLRGGKGKDNCIGGTGNDSAKCEAEKSI